MKQRHKRHRVRPSEDRLALRPLPTLEAGLTVLEEERMYWGFFTTPGEAEMSHWSGATWRRELAKHHVVEARIFGCGVDVHWLEDRGVLLAQDAEQKEPQVIGGVGWSERDRRSRLWGEWLEGTDTWYEERIPRPLRYPGLEASARHRFPFLEYREYIRNGVVESVRYLHVKGAA